MIELGRPVSVVRRNIDKLGRPYHTAVTIRNAGTRLQLLIDIYYPTGTTGETIDEQHLFFNNLDEITEYLKNEFNIALHEFCA